MKSGPLLLGLVSYTLCYMRPCFCSVELWIQMLQLGWFEERERMRDWGKTRYILSVLKMRPKLIGESIILWGTSK